MGERDFLTEEGLTRRAMLAKAGGLGAALVLRELLPPLRSAAMASAADPVAVPGKEKMIVRSDRPLNLEMPIGLVDSWITPSPLHFVRCHYEVPAVDAEAWRLRVDGDVERPLALSLEELKRLPAIEEVVTLECAGNGRSFFDPKVPGTQWQRGAVGTARYKGVRLADVLREAGLRPSGKHVLFDGADRPPVPTTPDFVRSIPLDKAMSPETLLAYEMNGEPLPAVHGFPLRAIVPGWIGSANVKWLARVSVLEREHDGHYMVKGYRSPRTPVAPGEKVDPGEMVAVTDLDVKSVIARPADGARVAAGPVRIAGAAWAGEAEIERVDVSVDFGRTWQPARLGTDQARFAWRLWDFEWTAKQPGAYLVMSRASDSRGRTQPIAPIWNPNGYLWNVVDQVRVRVEKS
jgi:DMSO/TMAO reductase YedYZ molybdopterin-dependent catalytic subunit